MTSSTRSSSDGETVSPMAFAVFQVDHQLQCRRLLNGQVNGLRPLEDLVDVARHDTRDLQALRL
jgi:hypothetical protein